MARKCEICGKGTIAGNSAPRKGLPKKKGGAGQHIIKRTKRTFKPNIVKVQATVAGSTKQVKVCTKCLKAGKVEQL